MAQVCCLCQRKGKIYGKNLKRIDMPSFRHLFKLYVGSAEWNKFKNTDVICPKCHMKVRNSTKTKTESGQWVFSSFTPGACPERHEIESEIEMKSFQEPATSPATSHIDNVSSSDERSMSHQEYGDENVDFQDIVESESSGESEKQFEHNAQAEQEEYAREYNDVMNRPLQRSSYPNMKSVNATEKRCFICKDKNGRNRLPRVAIKQVWDVKNICIPIRNRCCAYHLENNMFTYEAMVQIKAEKPVNMSSEKVAQWFLDITTVPNKTRKKTMRFDFSRGSIPEEDYETLLGLCKKDFQNLFGYIKGALRSSCNRSPENGLAMFLMMLRLNVSQKVLAIMFGIPNQSTVSFTITNVLDALVKNFVPSFLGLDHMSREQALQQHSRNMYNSIFSASEDSLLFIMDGTYLYIDKPTDFTLQKKTYSGQKKRNLVKPFMVVLPSGYVLDVPGPFYADGKNNDAGILNALLRPGSKFFEYIDPTNDHFIVDRGFRDSMSILSQLNIKTHMPQLLKHGEVKFTTKEANDSRLVTLCRWLVEAANGRFKNMFKFLADQIPGSYLPKLDSFFRVAVAIINAYCPPLMQDTERNMKFAAEALRRAEVENLLEEEVKDRKLDKRTKKWIKASVTVVPDFPRLDKDDLELLTLGVYQVNLATRYAKLHDNESSGIDIWLNEECRGILRAKVESRFTSNKSHNLWIKYEGTKSGIESITGHFCQCKQGSRTIGCCSHVTAVIWYLSFHRHLTDAKEPKMRKVPFLNAATLFMDAQSDSDISEDH